MTERRSVLPVLQAQAQAQQGGQGAPAPKRPMDKPQAVALTKEQLQRLWLQRGGKVALFAFFVLALVWYLDKQAGQGVGGEGFTNIAVQCVFKSYANVDTYVKRGHAGYKTATEVITASSDGKASFFSRDFATDKADRHNYTAYYDKVFAPYVTGGDDVSVLEIGVKKGGSIKLWRELFSPRSMIYGMDIDSGVPMFPKDSRIKILVGSSADADVTTPAFESTKLDLIIDDGDHRKSMQYKTFKLLFSSLTETGLYVIEDVYHFEPSWYEKAPYNMRWSRHADTSGEEELVFLYPPKSKASLLNVGLNNCSAGLK